MTQYVEWAEPHYYGQGDSDCITITMRASIEDAIRYQREHVKFVRPDFEYKDDQQALNDFITTCWGVLKGD